jgi:hypothetical protein
MSHFFFSEETIDCLESGKLARKQSRSTVVLGDGVTSKRVDQSIRSQINLRRGTTGFKISGTNFGWGRRPLELS